MNKKTILFVLIIVCVGAWFLFFKKTPLTNYPPQGNTVMMFGDSLVEGVGATKGNDLPSLIGRGIGVPVLNFGKSGNTTSDGVLRVSDALVKKPNIVLILLGGNDALRRVSRVDTEKNLRSIISTFQNAGAVTVLLGVRGGILGDPYDSMYEDIADSTGSAYISDVLSGLFADSRYMSDAIHPNDAGYAKIALRVIPLVKDILGGKY
jgi:lysophospholipase L1-like esterase